MRSLNFKCLFLFWVFPGGSDDKESVYNVGEPGSIPGSGGSPEEGSAYPFQYSCLENPWAEEPGGLQSMGSQRIVHTEQLTHSHFHLSLLFHIPFLLVCTVLPVISPTFVIFSFTRFTFSYLSLKRNPPNPQSSKILSVKTLIPQCMS